MTFPANSRQIRRELAQQRSDELGNEGTVIAYEAEGGAPLEVQGDTEAPYLKVPPFTEDPQEWLPDTLLPVMPYLTTPSVDVKQFRSITVYLIYTIPVPGAPAPPEGVGQLSVIPEVQGLDAAGAAAQWFTLAVINNTVTAITPAAPFNLLTAAVLSRDFAPTELRWPPAAAVAAIANPVVLATQLVFDVSGADAFRLNLAELNVDSADQNTINLRYARSQ